MRKTIQTLILTLALTGLTYAGEMHTPVITPPPPPSDETTQGDMQQPLTETVVAILEIAFTLG